MTDVALLTDAKLFVLDTNVILHDAGCLQNFQENDIAVPITVLEELDRFKKGNEDVNYQARSFLRRVDELTRDVLSPNGVSLGPGLGSIRVILDSELNPRLKDAFLADSPDHRILSVALTLQEHENPRQVVMVTKDTNLRMKAKSFGLTSQDYNTDKVESIDKLYTGKRLIEGLSTDSISEFSKNGGRVSLEKLDCVSQPRANENFVLRNGTKSVLATYDSIEREFVRIEKLSAAGIFPETPSNLLAGRPARRQSQARHDYGKGGLWKDAVGIGRGD